MKTKRLSEEQIKISIDRLTRFKPTEEKYLRVFGDIIVSNLIEPKLKKSDVLKLDYAQIRDYATEIFNSSLEESQNDLKINQFLKEYENAVFVNNKNVQILLDNCLNYESAIKLIKDSDVLNLQWLKELGQIDSYSDITVKRKEKGFLYPLEKIVIAEGITEEILLPVFAKLCGFDFNENGVQIIAAGGKNQVVKLYYKMAEEVKIPIFVLLDKDAESNEELINSRLRKGDKIHLVNSGEFEDLLPKQLIVKTVNNEFRNFVSITENDLDTGLSTVMTLEELFKEKCLHEFKKAEFAHRVKQQITSERDISSELKEIIDEIRIT